MKNIRNLTALMSGMVLALSVMALPTGTYASSLEDMLKENPVDNCTMEVPEYFPIDASQTLDNEYRTPVKVSEIAKNSVDDTAEEQNAVDDTVKVAQNVNHSTIKAQDPFDNSTLKPYSTVKPYSIVKSPNSVGNVTVKSNESESSVIVFQSISSLTSNVVVKTTDKQNLADHPIGDNKVSSISSDSIKLEAEVYSPPASVTKVK